MPLSADQLKQIISSTTNESLQSTIEVLCYNLNINENEKNVILPINSLLTNAKTRAIGLKLINAIISHCSSDTIKDNAVNWGSNCIIHSEKDDIKEIKLKTLTNIIKSAEEIETFNKKFSSEYLGDTLKMCLNFHSTSGKDTALKCLTQCMRRYPSWFSNHKHKVEPFLVAFLENSGKIKDAAIAFHFFQQTGSAGVDGINYFNNFSTQFKKLCGTVHNLYDNFFENIPEIDNTEKIDGETFIFGPFPPNYDSQKILEGTAFRIINCLVFIKTMLEKQFPVPKQIVPKYVIDIINRGLSVHVCLSEQNISLETNSQFLLLNKIQLQLLQLMRVLIKGHLCSLLPFSYVITKTLLNILKRTQNCDCFSTDISYKTSIYKILKEWLFFSKNVHQPHIIEMLIPILLKDISPEKKKVLLNVNISTKNKSKGIHGFESGIQNTTEKVICRFNHSLKEENCLHALDILKCLFTVCPVPTNSTHFQEAITTIVKNLFDVQSNRTASPYTNTKCQIKLYEVLISFFNQEHVALLPPIHLVITLLNKGLNNLNCKIRQTCSEGLEILEKISQPVCSSLYISDSENQMNAKTVINHIEFEKYSQNIMEEEIEDDQNFETQIEEDDTEKEIKIISNIVISQSNGDVQENENKDVITDEKDIEIPNETNKIEPDFTSQESVEDTEEPPEKKRKDEDEALEDMFNSFQDVIQ